jgi:3-deoxy-D-manno-octulosonate 8-phosphate phosphatase (KDO 8-P phosphatase)
VAFRAKELGISHVFQGNPDKRNAYDELKELTGLKDAQIAYIGDDLIDLPIMLQVGLPMAVADAEEPVRAQSLVVSCKNGGHGAVRELLEFIFKVQGKWEDIMADFLLPDSSSGNKNWKQ